MSEKPITKSEVRDIINNQEDSISQLINPEELVHQDIDSWEEADIELLMEELGANLDEWHFMATHPYEGLIQELATSLFMDDMVRVPFDHLVFDSRDKAVIEGYWLYDMSNREVMDCIHENKQDIGYFHEYEQESQMFIESCVVDAQVKDIQE